jgi:queuine tRNA-ribosyltransferase
MADFSFKVLKKDKKTYARLGIIKTKHGDIETPYFIPVATLASVRALDSEDIISLGAQCTLSNTYHLHLRPGDELIKKMGGLHKFMNFSKPIFTDSGGFQAFSLGYGMEHNINKLGTIFPDGKKTEEKKPNLCKIDDKGVTFTSIYDGTKHFMDAKISMKIQSNLGSDIIMAFDECTSPLSD